MVQILGKHCFIYNLQIKQSFSCLICKQEHRENRDRLFDLKVQSDQRSRAHGERFMVNDSGQKLWIGKKTWIYDSDSNRGLK